MSVTTTQVECLKCGENSKQSEHKGNAVEICPGCGDILYRRIGGGE